LIRPEISRFVLQRAVLAGALERYVHVGGRLSNLKNLQPPTFRPIAKQAIVDFLKTLRIHGENHTTEKTE
jgi:hypothetical protein